MDKYIILNETAAKKYASEKIKEFTSEASLSCIEIGDGNLNHIFRIKDTLTETSVILKQALPYARTSKEMALTAERCKIEAMALMEQYKWTGGMVPEVYHFDSDLCAMLMEDMVDYQVLREALMEQKDLPNLAQDAASFFANTLLKSSDIVMDSKEKKEQVARFINKDLCELTEALVLTNPAFPAKRNNIAPEVLPFVEKEIFANEALTLEFAKLKHKFMTQAQALLHGDAHSGSVFVQTDSTIFFDTEFSFYGPMGFDVGMFIANVLMNVCYQDAYQFSEYKEKVSLTVAQFVEKFKKEFSKVWDENGTEHFAKNSDSFKEYYLNEVLKDAAGFCGAEMIRRTTGSSHVKEMDEHNDLVTRKKVQINNMTMGVELILQQDKYLSGDAYQALLKTYL